MRFPRLMGGYCSNQLPKLPFTTFCEQHCDRLDEQRCRELEIVQYFLFMGSFVVMVLSFKNLQIARGCRASSTRGAKRNKLGNVGIFVQMIFGPGWSANKLYKNPNIV